MDRAPSESIEDGKTKERGIRVMLVDDSAVIRGLISRTLEKESGIEIVSSVSNGEMAVNAVKRADPDVIILDIEMPVMDGITALPLILKEKPDAKVLMCSTLSLRGADISLKALTLGATECIGKPTSSADIAASAGAFSAELLRLVKTLGGESVRTSPLRPRTGEPAARPVTPAVKQARPPAVIKLRSDPHAFAGKPDILAIGSSTGGPQALLNLMKSFAGIDIPIIITQHMPKTFTTVLARHIEQNCGLPCHEGAEGMILEKGSAYVAPGGFHMTFERKDNQTFIRVDNGPAENYCKPSVDPMMRSAMGIYGKKILAVILTGMGHDGLESCRALAESGGRVVAQDQATSVVWGMPGAVAEAGLCTAVLPLNEIGSWVHNAVMGTTRAKRQ